LISGSPARTNGKGNVSLLYPLLDIRKGNGPSAASGEWKDRGGGNFGVDVFDEKASLERRVFTGNSQFLKEGLILVRKL